MNNRSDPEVHRHLDAENAYCAAMLSPTLSLQQELFLEFVSRSAEEDSSLPVQVGQNFYYQRWFPGKQHPVCCRAVGAVDGPEEVLLDLNEASKGLRYLRLRDYKISPDERYLAYSIDTTGRELFDLYVKDLRSGDLVAGPIPNCGIGIEWVNDSSAFFYTTRDHTTRISDVKRHLIGSDPATDDLVHHEADPIYEVSVSKTASDDTILLEIFSYSSTETRIADASRADSAFEVLVPRAPGLEYSVARHGATIFIRTNDGASDFRVVEAPAADPRPVNWKEIVAEEPGVKIERVHPFESFLALSERREGARTIRVIERATGQGHLVSFPDDIYSVSIVSDQDNTSDKLILSYSTPTSPGGTYEYDMRARALSLLHEETLPPGYDPANYVAEKTLVTSHDGAQVPVYLVYNKALKSDGGNPVLLQAYGAYSCVLYDPAFSAENISLLDRGVVCAYAHPRGGGEKDSAWYRDGKLANKLNTMLDYIAVAEHLKAEVAHDEGLASYGLSAGGLLIGSVINMRPELFAAVVADVPFVDALTTMLDPSIPLTTTEFVEWGHPAKDKQIYDYIRSYSPYDNVCAQEYPPLLVVAGLTDSRVQYWEPAKWVAKLRAMKIGDSPVLLNVNMSAGHAGVSGRYDEHREMAMKYAFILDKLGAS